MIPINVKRIRKEMMKKDIGAQDLSWGSRVSLPTVYKMLNTGYGTQKCIAKVVYYLGLDPDKVIVEQKRKPIAELDTDKIEKLMDKKKITYEAIGKALGVSKQAVWKTLHATRPRHKSIRKISEVLGVQPEELFKGVEQ